VIRLADCQKAD